MEGWDVYRELFDELLEGAEEDSTSSQPKLFILPGSNSRAFANSEPLYMLLRTNSSSWIRQMPPTAKVLRPENEDLLITS